ncbi:MAG: hypothetical protein HC898_08705 [Phycisphaerales bacterium]|nr:hypothetical protein [Phycisphaerales bacterium]
MDDASWLEIDLSRVSYNLSCWKALVHTPTPLHQRITPVKVCAVVKADAYGLGVLPIARELEKSGVDMLAVYSPLQAMELLEAGVKVPLLVLMPMSEKAWELFASGSAGGGGESSALGGQ